MNALEIVSTLAAFAGIGSFIFAIYEYSRRRRTESVLEKSRLTEISKNEIQKERLRNIHFSIVSALNSADHIVQYSKEPDANVVVCQELARNTRAQLVILEKQVRLDRRQLDTWRFGSLVESQHGSNQIDQVEDHRAEESLPKMANGGE